jgi:hypothetical protein
MNSEPGISAYLNSELATVGSEAAYEAAVLARTYEPARFLNEYRSFDFDAMSEVPEALDAFVSHQHDFDL